MLEQANIALSALPPGTRVLAAVSGGLDSMCLLHLLCRGGQGLAVTAAHFNHGLRGECADRDEAFVQAYCAQWGIPCVCGRGDVRALAAREHLSVEEAARTLRYGFLERTAREQGCERILTAHHADDNAETMLLNLIRGTGVRGLSGIPAARGKLLRPLRNVSRAELEQYAQTHDIPHQEDETNALDDAARNVLRHQVLPVLKRLNPRAVEHMAAAADLLRAVDEDITAAAEHCLSEAEQSEGRITLPLSALAAVPESVGSRVLLELFERLGAGCRDVGAVHLAALRRLTDTGQEGNSIHLPGGVTARREDSKLILERRPLPLRTELTRGVPLRWGQWTLTLLDHAEGPGLALGAGPPEERLYVAPCEGVGSLRLPGARGARTVKRLCLDRHISLEERTALPAFYWEDRLAAVWPLGVDIVFLPEGTPCRFVQIIKQTEENNHDE